jgi:hypothetical protein
MIELTEEHTYLEAGLSGPPAFLSKTQEVCRPLTFAVVRR